VILVHRLLKNAAAEAIGSRGYLLPTQECVNVLEVVWEWLTSPVRQCKWKGEQVLQGAGGGGHGAGTTNPVCTAMT